MGRVVKIDNIEKATIDTAKKAKTGKKPANPKKSPLFRVGIFLVAGYLLFAFGNQFLQINQMDREIVNIKNQIKVLEMKNREIKKEIRQLQSDTYVERIAREKLGLVKPGETVILPAKQVKEN
ncbi:MAG: septum formation initiator family protein [Clostridia bacterium]|nr:septum formation initiator family protein [Clostridia bacterium]